MPYLARAAGEIIMAAGWASALMKAENGFFSVILMVIGSTTSVLSMTLNWI
ncbi:hypothetical protein D3C85_1207280 [compost metagenome]